jgi:hypothetical protein
MGQRDINTHKRTRARGMKQALGGSIQKAKIGTGFLIHCLPSILRIIPN